MKEMTRTQFGLRLLQYHGGGGSATYALGSSILAGIKIGRSTIFACRDEMGLDAARATGWLSCALHIWERTLTDWLDSGKTPWRGG